MANNNLNSWRDLFQGRQEQLERLAKVWQQVKCGKPRIAVVLGESGLGKTRLVQEFFAYISQNETDDPDQYWPSRLEVGRNLAINPRPDTINTQVPIPWLWWGMRFSIPNDRNQAPQVSPFIREDADLLVHAYSIARLRKLKELNRDAIKTFTTLVMDLAGFSLLENLVSVWDLYKQRQLGASQQEIPISEVLARQVQELVNQTLATLSMFLRKSDKDSPTVPVILLIDDAQWMDPVTLHAIDIIFSEALRCEWPLMIICTHWHKEWNEYPNLAPDSMYVENLKQLFQRLEHSNRECVYLEELEKLKEYDLRAVVEAALPGLDSDDYGRLLSEADGNPRAIEEMILLLHNRPKDYFLDGVVGSPLNRRGKNRIARLSSTDLFKLVLDRFSELDTKLQDLLSTGALFGPEYIHPLVVDLLLSNEVDEYESFGGIQRLSQQAQDIHVLTHRVSQLSDCFQQRLYFLVAEAYLKSEDDECYRSRVNAVSVVLNAWLVPEKYKQLAKADQIKLFKIAMNRKLLEPDCSIEPCRLARTFDQLYLYFNGKKGYEFEIALWWESLLDRAEESWVSIFVATLQDSQLGLLTLLEYDSSYVVRTIEFVDTLMKKLDEAVDNNVPNTNAIKKLKWLVVCGDVLSMYSTRIDESKKLYEKALELSRSIIGRVGSTPDRIQYVLFLLRRKAKIAFDNGDLNIAKNCYDESLQMSRDLLIEYGRTPERMRELAVSLNDVAQIAHREGDMEVALRDYKESLAISRQLVEEYGETSDRIRDVAVGLEDVAKIFLESGDLELARRYFAESLKIHRRLKDEFGSVPSVQRDVSLALSRVAQVAYASGELSAAKCDYLDALAIARQLIAEYGVTRERLRDVAVCLNNIAQIAQDEGEMRLAEEGYIESLAISRQLIDTYGVSPERLRDLAISLDDRATLLLSNGYVQAAKSDFFESLGHYRDLLKTYGEMPERVRDLSRALTQMAQVEYLEGDLNLAKRNYRRSLAITKGLLRKQGATPERLRDVSVILNNLAMISIREKNNPVAKKYYCKALAIRRRLIRVYGETPERLTDLSASLHRLARIEEDGEPYSIEAVAAQRRLIELYGGKDVRKGRRKNCVVEIAQLELPQVSMPSAETDFIELIQDDWEP